MSALPGAGKLALEAGADCFLYRPDLPTEDFVKEVARFIRSAVGI